MSIKDEWLTHPVTEETLFSFRAEERKLQCDLLAAGRQSSDPAVSAIAGQLYLIGRVIDTISETETTNEEESTQ